MDVVIRLINQVDWANPTDIVAHCCCLLRLFRCSDCSIHNILHTDHRPVIQVVSSSLDGWAALPMSKIYSKRMYLELIQISPLLLPNSCRPCLSRVDGTLDVPGCAYSCCDPPQCSKALWCKRWTPLKTDALLLRGEWAIGDRNARILCPIA